jgi:hypothetical protein
MYQAVYCGILVFLLIAWIVAETRGGAWARVPLGLATIAFVGLMWFFAELRMANLEACHQALFRQIGAMVETGEIEKVKHAASAYNNPHPGSLRVFQALDAIEGKRPE